MKSSASSRSGPRWLLIAALVLLGIELILLIVSIPGHRIHLDEAWIGEQAYFLANGGYVRSNLFAGFAGNGERIVVYHYLFVRAGAEIVGLFGWGLWQLRLVPILSGLLLVAMIVAHVCHARSEPWSVVAVTLAIFLLVPVNFEYIKVFRPETMAALFGFGSFVLLEKFQTRPHLGLAVSSGAAAAASALAHPYGAVFAVTGVVLLLIGRRGWGIALFAMSAMLVVLPSVLEILGHKGLFETQIANPLVVEKTRFTALSPLYNLSREHMRLFRNAGTIPLSTLFVIAVWQMWYRRAPRDRFLLVYTIVLLVVVGALVQDKIDRYGMLLFPWFAIIVGHFLERLLRGGPSPVWVRFAAAVAGIVLLGYGLAYQTRSAFDDKMDVAGLNDVIGGRLPSGATVVGPMNMIFNEIGRFDIAATKLAAIRGGGTPTAKEITGLASERAARYLVFNRYQTREEGLEDSTEVRQLERWFMPVAVTDSFEVWERRDGKE